MVDALQELMSKKRRQLDRVSRQLIIVRVRRLRGEEFEWVKNVTFELTLG